MKRFALASSMVMLVGTAVYACSDDPETKNNPDSGPDGNTGVDGSGNDSSTGNDAGQDTNQPPTKCAYFEDPNAKNKPDLQPAACKDCAAQRCCTQITTCYG